MPSSDDAARLAHLERILADTEAIGPAAHADVAREHLNSLPVERIRRLTAELRGDTPRTADHADIATIRQLLSDYSIAIGHLRAVARMAATTVDAAAEPIRNAHKMVHRLSKELALVKADSSNTPQ